MIALKNGDPRQAIKILTDANNVLDTWLAHFDLGRAYLALSAFPEAELEFESCISRRGEALSLLVDEEPTYGHFPMVYYYQGQAREGLKNAAATASYGEYLKIRGKSTEDPLLPDVRKRGWLVRAGREDSPRSQFYLLEITSSRPRLSPFPRSKSGSS